eukprot:m.100162 g.100162  ORF g.100162 m.100162 type:complete len:58 (-) comp15615_c1_seq4:263-436(-)
MHTASSKLAQFRTHVNYTHTHRQHQSSRNLANTHVTHVTHHTWLSEGQPRPALQRRR